MAQKTYGSHKPDYTPPAQRDHAAEIYEAVGVSGFPLSVSLSPEGELIGASYETEWREGDTKAVTKKGKVVDYKENYTDHKLSAAEIKKIDSYLKDNVKTI